MPATVHDVAILSDFRYPGGTSASIAAEVHAQAEAALSTVLVHVLSPHQPGAAVQPADQRPAARRRRRAGPRRPAGLRPAAADPPAADLHRDLKTVPRVRADRTVMVINQPPGDAETRPGTTTSRRSASGCTATSATASSGRRSARRSASRCCGSRRTRPLAAEDWHEIIDVAHWWRDRDGFVGDVPVIGRHGRADPVKWPREPGRDPAGLPRHRRRAGTRAGRR